MHYVLGVDIGSYSSKGILLNDSGQIVAAAERKHEMIIPAPGLAEHDADEDWWGGFRYLSQRLLSESRIDPRDIAAVGCSGIGPCMLPVDAFGRPLRRAVLYGIDTRARGEIDDLNAELGEESIFALCGNALTTQSVGPKIRWLRNREPDIFAQTRKIATCSSYLNFKLTGQWSIDRYSASCFTPCYDLRGGGWAAATTSAICPPEWLPNVAWSSEIIGEVTPEAASQTGLSPGTPVIAGTIDSASEALSVGVGSPGDLMIMYGTTVFFIQVTSDLRIDRRHWAAPFLFPGSWAVMGGLATSGALTHWLRDEIFGLPPTDSAFAAMAEGAARSPPGANGLIVLPFFSGERTPINDPYARGVFFGLTLAHRREDLYRAVIEGIGHAVRHNLEVFAEAGAPTAVYAVGGGVRNALWTQTVADIARTEQRIREHTIGAALGSAFLAGIGAGMFERGDIEKINPIAKMIAPRKEIAAGYDRDHAIYLALYDRTKDLSRSLWSTAGQRA